MRWHSRTMLNQNRVTAAASEPGFMTRDINHKYKSRNPFSLSHFSQILPLNAGSRSPNTSQAFCILPSKCWKQLQVTDFLSNVCLGKWLVDFADWTGIQMFRWIYYKYVCHFCASLSPEVIIQMPSELRIRKSSTTSPPTKQNKTKKTTAKEQMVARKKYLTWLVNN